MQTTRFRRTLGLMLAALLATAALAEGPKISWDLDDALRQVDRQADDFKSAMARVDMVRRDLDGKELSSETGTVFMDNRGNIRLDVDGPTPRTLMVTKS